MVLQNVNMSILVSESVELTAPTGSEKSKKKSASRKLYPSGTGNKVVVAKRRDRIAPYYFFFRSTQKRGCLRTTSQLKYTTLPLQGRYLVRQNIPRYWVRLFFPS
jgi:hypothetical protein